MEATGTRLYKRLMKPFFISYVNRDGQRQTTPISLARTHDISIGGAALELSYPVQAGSVMEMEIELENALFAVNGKVVYVHRQEGEDSWRAGVRFSEPQYAILDLLAATFHAPLN